MNDRHMVALIAVVVALHATWQAYSWLVDTLNHIVRAIH
jgi:hypothetical protein